MDSSSGPIQDFCSVFGGYSNALGAGKEVRNDSKEVSIEKIDVFGGFQNAKEDWKTSNSDFTWFG